MREATYELRESVVRDGRMEPLPRYRTLLELEHSDARLRSLMANSSDVVIITAPDGTVSWVGSSLPAVLGLTATDLMWRGAFAFVHPDDFAKTRTLLATAAMEPSHRTIEEIRFRHGNGEWRILECTIINLLEDPGVQGIVIHGRDVTERKRAEEERNTRLRQQTAAAEFSTLALAATELPVLLQHAADILRTTLDTDVTAILELDADGGRVKLIAGAGDWAAGVVGALELPTGSGSLAGLTIERNEPVIIDDLRSEERLARPIALVELGMVSALSVVIPGRAKPFGVLGAYTRRPRRFDVNDARFVQTIANLLSTAVERRRFEEHIAFQARMEAVGRLAAGIAHDFNNLLTAMLGGVQFIAAQVQDRPQAVADLEHVKRAAERASRLTRQLLAFSRKQVLQPRVIDLNEVVRETDRMLERMIGEDICKVSELSDRPLFVRADPVQLEQIVINLAVNARDAMPGGGTLTLRTRTGHPPGATDGAPGAPDGWAVLEVADTGAGMTPEVVSRIFEPFFTTKKLGRGTGLGLSTVYGTVEQTGGRIEVETEPGRGSAFRVYIPLAAEPQAAATDAAPATAESTGGTETILVVEDDDIIRRLVSRTLHDAGYHVLAASHADEACDLARRHDGRIHLLFTDVVMPGRSGRELAEELGRQRPDMRVLFTSGYSSDNAVLRGVSEAAFALVPKPYSPSDLLTHIRQQLFAG